MSANPGATAASTGTRNLTRRLLILIGGGDSACDPRVRRDPGQSIPLPSAGRRGCPSCRPATCMHGLSDRQLLVLLLQFTLLLGAARALGAAVRRFGQPSVMGEVIAGVLLGPTVLGRLSPSLQVFLFPKDAQQGGLLELLSWI